MDGPGGSHSILILVRLGYPPVVVLKAQRVSYLRAMQRADRGDYGPLGEILARGMLDNLNRFILPGIAGPAKLVPIAASWTATSAWSRSGQPPAGADWMPSSAAMVSG